MSAEAARALRPGVFLDRDGTLNEDVDFLRTPDELVLLPGVVEAVRALNAADFRVAVVTNQSGIARGFLDEAALERIHAELERRLARGGARLDGIYHCPHHPTQGEAPYRMRCSCRKPEPGLLQRAARELSIDLAQSFVIGDSVRDLEAGARLGVAGILVATGKGVRERELLGRLRDPPPRLASDLGQAVELLLADRRRPQGR